jgi:hypothetical protein
LLARTHALGSRLGGAARLDLLRQLHGQNRGSIRDGIRRQIIAAALFTRTTATATATATARTIRARRDSSFGCSGVCGAAEDRLVVVVFGGEQLGRVSSEFGA